MLNSVEINHLEKKWQKWRMRKIISQLLIVSIFLCIIPIIWIMYNYLPLLFSGEVQKKNIPTTIIKNTEQNISEHNNSTIPTPPSTPKKVQAPLIEQPMSEEEIIEYVKAKKSTSSKEQVMEEEFIELEPDEEDEYMQQEMQKPKLEIQTTYISKKQASQKRGENSVTHALKLAEKFYNKKDYKQAQKWALKANDLDSKNEKSWIIFAKSLAKNGKPTKAIQALNAYLKTNPNSKQATALIRKIKHGDY